MGSIETVFSIIILVITGYVLKSLGVLREEDATPLNRVVINVAIPSLIFTSSTGQILQESRISCPYQQSAY